MSSLFCQLRFSTLGMIKSFIFSDNVSLCLSSYYFKCLSDFFFFFSFFFFFFFFSNEMCLLIIYVLKCMIFIVWNAL